MANFDESYDITMSKEGLYSNDADDLGGETYKGISRKFHDSWKGWNKIDEIKNSVGLSGHPQALKQFNKILSDSKELGLLVKEFYKENFWDIFKGDSVKSQSIANELFDTSVNMGVHRAVTFLQMSLNVLNRDEKLYKNLIIDGNVGKMTIEALNILLTIPGDEACLYKVLNILQGNHYINQMLKTDSQKKFARGWLDRVNFIKS